MFWQVPAHLVFQHPLAACKVCHEHTVPVGSSRFAVVGCEHTAQLAASGLKLGIAAHLLDGLVKFLGVVAVGGAPFLGQLEFALVDVDGKDARGACLLRLLHVIVNMCSRHLGGVADTNVQ